LITGRKERQQAESLRLRREVELFEQIWREYASGVGTIQDVAGEGTQPVDRVVEPY
jgi:hypothetical protein